jgi:hypothetical protein
LPAKIEKLSCLLQKHEILETFFNRKHTWKIQAKLITKPPTKNWMVTSLSTFDAYIDRKWNSAIVQQTKIANKFETDAITTKTCAE